MRWSNLVKKLIFVLSLSAIMAGCQNTTGTRIYADHHTGSSRIEEDNFFLRLRVHVLDTSYDEVNGLKRVHYTLQSNRRRRLQIDYRISWFDANGTEIDSSSKAYRNLILEGKDTTTITGVANSPQAVSSKLRFRETSKSD